MIARMIAALLAALALSAAMAAGLPYDEKADAYADLKHALTQAQTEHKNVLLVFGANWCPDCRALDKALHDGKAAPLIDKQFVVTKVDVGNFDKNTDIANLYGNPIKKGIPAAVVLTPDNRMLYATKAGELADARHMSDNGIYDFFERVVKQGHP